MTEKSELETLQELYEYIGSRICELTSHDWRELTVESNDVDLNTLNLSGVEVCTRCGHRRLKSTFSTNDTVTTGFEYPEDSES